VRYLHSKGTLRRPREHDTPIWRIRCLVEIIARSSVADLTAGDMTEMWDLTEGPDAKVWSQSHRGSGMLD
jgi:hypothetical protein